MCKEGMREIRIEAAQAMIDSRENSSGDTESDAIDAIADLFHWCEAHSLDAEKLVRVAFSHYQEER